MTVPTLVVGLNALLLLVLMVVCCTEAANLQLAWDPWPSQMAGYKLHHRQNGGDEIAVGDLTNQSSCILSGLESGPRYFFTTAVKGSWRTRRAFADEISGLPSASHARPPTAMAPYTFDGESGSLVSEASGEAIHGTVVGATWTPQRQFGGAFCYIYASADRKRPIIRIGVVGISQNLCGASRLPGRSWTYLAQTSDGITLKRCQNGAEVVGRFRSGSAQKPIMRLAMGGSDLWREFFQGRADEVRINPGVLIAGEIHAIFVLPFPPLQRANHSKECDAKPLACVPMPWTMVAGLPGTQSTS